MTKRSGIRVRISYAGEMDICGDAFEIHGVQFTLEVNRVNTYTNLECFTLSALFHKFSDVFETIDFEIYSVQDDTILLPGHGMVVNDTPLWSPHYRGDEKGPPYQLIVSHIFCWTQGE